MTEGSGASRATLEHAIEEALRVAPLTAPERVPLGELPGRRLARAVLARAPIPAFTNSAMDGYAVRGADTPGRLPLAGEHAAGDAPGSLPTGAAARIATGAPLPAGADAVVRQEHVQLEGGGVVIASEVPPGADVRKAGEDMPAGGALLRDGTRLAAHEVGVVAAGGHAWAWCWRRPRVALLVSGSEFAAPGTQLAPGRVYESNRHAVAAQARATGGDVTEIAMVPDDGTATLAEVRRLLHGGGWPPDLLVTVGGLSVGPHDHVRGALEEAGVRWVVAGLAARPGQPTRIGVRGGQAVLALAGNPLSAIACFHVFGRALLEGSDPFTMRLPLAALVEHPSPLARLLRCRVEETGLGPLARQGSADIGSLEGARALAWIPPRAGRLDAGTLVRASPLT